MVVGGEERRTCVRRGEGWEDFAMDADGYRVCLKFIFISLASDQGGSPAEFKHISKRRKRN